jgi:short-subunit dehydrogenase
MMKPRSYQMKVQGKTILVTGAGNGMGREMTLLLLRKGARVAGVDVNENGLKETAELAGADRDRFSMHVVNITDRSAVCMLPEVVIRTHGSIDGIINNAGIIQNFVRINDLDFSAIERVINVNMWGVINMTKVFLPYLLQRAEAHIVNTSSMGGFLPVPGQSVYGMTKAGVKLFTEGLTSELEGTNVHVTLVFPGAIATNIAGNSGIKMEASAGSAESSKFKMTLPTDAAAIIIQAMETNKTRVFVGSDSRMMDFLTRVAPEFARKLIGKQMKSLLPASTPGTPVPCGQSPNLIRS